jgi:hypothetical protein
VEKSKRNNQENSENTSFGEKRREEDCEQEKEGTIYQSRIVSKKLEKGYNIDEEISKTRIGEHNHRRYLSSTRSAPNPFFLNLGWN